MTDRSNRMEVRNPVLALPAMQAVLQESPETRERLARLLYELADDARRRSDDAWRRNKAWMAAYWRVVSVYARHVARAIRRGKIDQMTQEAA